MKTNLWWIPAACLTALAAGLPLGAAETAVVKGDIVNVRGQPSLNSEVVTQVKKGEPVTVLDEVTVKKPKADEPAKWAKILMPTNTPVWVSAAYVDTNGLVKPPKLNIRAGAGENYSVVGILHAGDTVKTIRVNDNWMEIEAGTNAYAFVAADLLEKRTAAPVTPVVEKPEPAKTTVAPPAPVATTTVPPPAVVPTEPPPTVAPEPKPEPVAIAPKEPAPVVPAETKPAALPAPVAATNPPPVLTPPPIAPAPVAKPEEPPAKRIVQREGWVRGTTSVQAPTYFELVSPETGKTVNYLHSSATNWVLKKYRGKKILVTGQEMMDVRWPRTPILEIETLRLAPNATK